MRVQRMCRRLVLLLLALACLCQMALAVNSNFRYGSKNVNWAEMEGSDVLLIDGERRRLAGGQVSAARQCWRWRFAEYPGGGM